MKPQSLSLCVRFYITQYNLRAWEAEGGYNVFTTKQIITEAALLLGFITELTHAAIA